MMRSLGNKSRHALRFTRGLLIATVVLFSFLGHGAALAQLPPPTPAKPDFQDRPFGPIPPSTPTPSPKRLLEEPSKPIPRGWIIGGIVAAVLATVALLYGCWRAWRASNLFDRQYRFPKAEAAKLRFGGNKCGGLMATVDFGKSRRAPEPAPASKTENA